MDTLVLSSELECRLKGRKASPHQGIPDPLTPPVADDNACIAEHLQVMTHRRLSLAEWFDEVAHADLASFRRGEDRDNPESRGVSQSGEACRQFVRTGIIEWGRKDRRTAHLDCGIDQSTSLDHALSSPIDIHGCIDHYKRIGGYECNRRLIMSRVQLALNVADIDTAVEFYSKLFGTEPAKRRPRYANFAIAEPPLKLVLIEDANQTPGTLNHLGVEVDSSDAVTAAQDRLAREGLATAMEEQTTCCYAVQDKVWVNGPGGEPWEIYTVLADAEMSGEMLRSDTPGEAVCCATHPELGSVTTRANSCC
jgi:catechol 2,3-dioxygenase-like lactoylglutathione lyase family enzyme